MKVDSGDEEDEGTEGDEPLLLLLRAADSLELGVAVSVAMGANVYRLTGLPLDGSVGVAYSQSLGLLCVLSYLIITAELVAALRLTVRRI